MAALEFGFGIVGTVISLHALRELGFTPGPPGLVFAVGGVSSLLAALLARRISRAVGVGRTMVGGLLCAGLGILLLPLAHGAGVAAFALLIGQQVIGDSGATIYEINQSSLRQRVAPARALGRINAATRSAGVGRHPARDRAALVTAALAAFLGALVLLSAPDLRRANRAGDATRD
ncbi:MAG: hypothetical protein ABI401_08255 [Candidatus Dormibacter sp.]